MNQVAMLVADWLCAVQFCYCHGWVSNCLRVTWLWCWVGGRRRSMKINQVHFDCSSIPHTLLLLFASFGCLILWLHIYVWRRTRQLQSKESSAYHNHHPPDCTILHTGWQRTMSPSISFCHPILYFTWSYVLATPIQKHSSTIKFIRLLNCDFMNLALSMTTTTCVIGLDVKCDWDTHQQLSINEAT